MARGGHSKYKIIKVLETSFMGGTIDTGEKIFLGFDTLSELYGRGLSEEEKRNLVEFARIANWEPGHELASPEEGVILPVEKYVHSDRSFLGRYFVRLPKNETGRYRYVEVRPE